MRANLAKEYLGKNVTVTMDRPLGSQHPKFGWKYPLNYGFIKNTTSADGEELDAYVLGVNTPAKEFTGICVAIIHRIDDDDDKLVVVPEKVTITDEEIKKQTHFQELFFTSKIIRK